MTATQRILLGLALPVAQAMGLPIGPLDIAAQSRKDKA